MNMSKRTWAQEKAYCAKRAEDLRKQMVVAIRECDTEQFSALMSTALRYMTKKQRGEMATMFYAHMVQ